MATIPTIQELKEQALADIESQVGRDAPLLPLSVWETLATAMAGLAYLILKFGQFVRRQIFVETADEDALLARGLEYGLTPTAATLFQGTFTATGTNESIIPIDSILIANGNTYVVTELESISGGSAVVNFQATQAGAASNLAVSNILEFATPLAGVNRSVTVTSVTQSGSDAEDLRAFRRRVQFRQQSPPQGGAIPDYILWATEVPGIAEAYIFNDGSTTVNVYPVTTSEAFDNRIPTIGKIAEVQAYLDDPDRRVLGANPIVLAFQNLPVQVTITNLVPNTLQLRTDIEEQIRQYLLARRPRQFPDEVDIRNGVNSAQICAIAIATGATFLEVALVIDGSPGDNYTLANDELVYLDDVIYA